MPRLKFDLQPVRSWLSDRPELLDDHNGSVREYFARHAPGQQVTPCDCGYWAPSDPVVLVHCLPQHRQECRKNAAKRLEQHYRTKHFDALKQKRIFPEMPRSKEKHACAWCAQPIVHGRFYQRGMHDGRLDEPNCRWLHGVHTDHLVQRSHLLKRDGRGCKSCGALRGRYGAIWTDPSDERVARTWEERGWIREQFAEQPAGPLTYITWDTHLEVDHFIALAVAWVAFAEDARRRWFFGPANLQMLCSDCHKAKTVEDRALLREIAQRGAEWAKAEVLRRLGEAGLLAARQNPRTP